MTVLLENQNPPLKNNKEELLKMKRISILLAICLLLGIPAQAAAPALFQYQSSQLGFSITVPGVRQGEVIAEETDTGVNFYHAPSREKYGGEIGSIVVVSPRSDFFSEDLMEASETLDTADLFN